MKPQRTESSRKKADPVLPFQGGRSMPVDPPPIHTMREETIRQKAFEIYEKRGRKQANSLEDWLDAESELTCAHPEHQHST